MPCSSETFPNIGTTHCYTAAGRFKFSNAPEVNYTGFARGCINCTGFNSPCLPFLIFINSWFVQSWIREKVLRLARQFSKPGKSLQNRDKFWENLFFFLKVQQVPYKWIFFVAQILFNLTRLFAVHHGKSFVPASFFKVLIDHLSEGDALKIWWCWRENNRDVVVAEKNSWNVVVVVVEEKH